MFIQKNTKISFLFFLACLFTSTFFLSANPLTAEQVALLKKELASLKGNDGSIADTAEFNDLLLREIGKAPHLSKEYAKIAQQVMYDMNEVRKACTQQQAVNLLTDLMRRNVEFLAKQLENMLPIPSQKQKIHEHAQVAIASIQTFDRENRRNFSTATVTAAKV